MRAVLTFHSIDDLPGPLSYSPAGLERMFDALDEAKARSVSDWLKLDLGYRAALRTLGGDGGDRSF